MSAQTYKVLNPATGETVEEFPVATDEQVQETLSAASSAYESWGKTDINERAKIVHRIAELFGERAEELGKIMTTEMGKPLSEAVGEAEFCKDIFEYFATEGPTLAADQEIKSLSGGRAVVQKRPIGPLLGIMPWNFPLYQVARFAAPNLMLGNTIILKHAESCPRSALAIQEIFDEAGVPAGVYNNLFATHDQISTIIEDPRIQGVSLTGSERAGAIIGEQAGRNLKKAVLELGGSDPFVVLDSQNISDIAETAWGFRIDNTGQACNSNKRMIVMEDIYDEFVSELTKRAEGLQPGDPMKEEDGTFAPMSSRKAAEDLHEQVQDAVSKGATLHAGGVLHDGPAAYYSPAVLTGVTKDMRAYYEELFGPVAVVYKVSSDEEALEMANDTVYGLGGSVHSEDRARAEKVAMGLQAGMASVNAASAEGAEMPFGGVKRSGFGRELGPLGMDEFVNKRLYYIGE
ncbi:NAD-dependent succinate-semialdehyde dehydrogenase [Glutamicibacter creatinolyticus]|uniref:LD-carboxypeptidase n=1 Tax=Glutamicibacter creatinolyticus TaxID=162496 RepID=A0A5B7WW00_9MICC|nr:NAD-dependent succinate-semialdehyde dehydrogenase [Glutamicibacter creatinolyticus]QCY48077.1 LD-carboxypeptidase [Glutamicibacter creatinolyticus]